MALISAILSLLSRKIGDLLQMLFGWSIAGLFGKLSPKKQTALSVALILSIIWPLMVVGCFLPAVAAWVIAFVPLHEWLGKTVLRVLWIVLAVGVPIVVGFLIAWVAPARKQRGSRLRTVIAGYPMTLGLFLSFLITFVLVPIVKIISMARRWEDDHVYLQVKEGAYAQVLEQLAHACERVGISVSDQPVPKAMQAPIRVLKWFARSALDPIIAENPRRLVGTGIQLFLYPADLLIRGTSDRMHRVRAAIVREMMRAPAYLTEDPKAQALEEQLNTLWKQLAPPPEESAASDHEQSAAKDPPKEQIPVLTRFINEVNVPYADWVLLYTNVNHLALVVSGDPHLVTPKKPSAGHKSDAYETEPRPDLSTLDLVKQAIRQSQELFKTEIALVRQTAVRRSER